MIDKCGRMAGFVLGVVMVAGMTTAASAGEEFCVKGDDTAYADMAIACYTDEGCKLVEDLGAEALRDYDRASVAAALGREKIEGIVTDSKDIIKTITGYGYKCTSAIKVLATAPPPAPSACLTDNAPISGELRKVTSRNGKEEIVTNWHIVTAEPLCIDIDGTKTRNVTDLQVVFASTVSAAAMDRKLGTALGLKGRFAYKRNDSDTGDIVVLDAVLYGDVDESGLVRQKD